MSDRDLCFTPATELARLYRARKVSPLEVMRAVLARIDAVNPLVNAYVTVVGEAVLGAARRATAALRRGATLLVLPTVAVKPFPVEQPYPTELDGKSLEDYAQGFFFTYAITVTGLPVISVPAGLTRDGLSVGLQIVGRRRQETAVVRAAAAFEAEAPWAQRIPPVVPSPRAEGRPKVAR